MIKFIFLFILILSACSGSGVKRIGNQISGPFAMNSFNETVFLVNSAFSGEFSDGSIHIYEWKNSELKLVKVFEVPRMGIDSAISYDGKYLAVSHALAGSLITLYDVSDVLNPKKVDEFRGVGGVRITNLEFVKLNDDVPYLLKGSVDTGSLSASVFLLNVVNSKLGIEFQFPRDVPKDLLTNYTPSYSSSVIHKESGLFLAFASRGAGARPAFLTPEEFYSQPIEDTPEYTRGVRAVSAVGVDLLRYFEEKSIEKSMFFTPITYDSSLRNHSEIQNATEIGILNYKLQFTRSFDLTGLCGDLLTPQDKDSLIVVDYSVGPESSRNELVKIQGIFGLKSLFSINQSSSYPVLKNDLSFSFYSRTLGVPELSSRANIVSNFRALKSEGKCIPVWARSEVDKNRPGNELVHLQWNEFKPAQEPGFFPSPVRSGSVFTTIGSDLISIGYVLGNFGIFKFNGETFLEVTP